MKRLALLRHAKSSWDSPGIDDLNRPLNERGWKAARRVGKELGARHIHFDLVLASMAARVRETIDGLQDKYEFAAPIRFDPSIYLASEARLLELARALDDNLTSVLFVGHNPGLERLVADLSEDDPAGLRARILGKFPTGTLAVLELPVQRWCEVGPGRGQVVELILPRELD